MPAKSKKRLKGPQPPQTGCAVRGIREVLVSVDADCPLISIPVGELKKCISWLVDSAAAKNIIDEVSFKEVYPGITLREIPTDLRFRTADGSPLRMVGYFISEFWIGQSVKRDAVYVCKGVMKTRLLGATLLSKFAQWGIDNRKGVFIADGERIPLIYAAGNPPRTNEVFLKEEVEIPGRCSRFIRAVLPNRYRPTEFIFRPEEKLWRKRDLLLPVCLVSSEILDGEVTVKVTNVSDKAKKIGKGTRVGKVVANLDEYEVIKDGERSNAINAVSVGRESVQNMEKKLKEEHAELYNLYTMSIESGEILDRHGCQQLLKLLYDYRDVFSRNDYDIGTTTIIKHQIVPKSEKIVYRRQYKHSEEQHKQIDEEVEKLLKSEVIKESMSPFNNPVLMVPKAEPGKWRFCLDCRFINDLTEDQFFPIPLIDEAMDGLAGASIFSTMDMTSGYHQVELEEEASEMCAFSTRKGHFQYTKLPMGLRGSGMTFQKMVTLLMSGMLHTEVLAYLDDCILFSKSVSQHMDTLAEVLSRLKKANLKLKPRKCNLFQKELVYLGFLVNKTGIRPNPDKVRKIKELAEPTNVREVQRFLGKANYYRKFVPKLAEIAHPLYELTKCKGKTQFQWEAEHQSAFDQLKGILCSEQVMGHPKFDKEFILDVDASDFALGVELTQKDEDGNERPIYYASRHLEKSERSYSATARETLAAVFGCEYFKQYLQGRKFIIRSDHNPLVWLRSMKDPKRPYNGWIVRLEQFQYEIQYRPGKQHVNADFNSRIPVSDEVLGHRSVGIQTEVDDSMQVCATTTAGLQGMETVEHMEELAKETSMQVCATTTTAEAKQKESSMQVCATTVAAEAKQGTHTEEYREKLEDLVDKTDKDELPCEFLAKQQDEDCDIGPVKQKLKNPEIRLDFTERGERLWKVKKNLDMKDGLLIRYHRFGPGKEPIEQVVLPGALKDMVLESLHDCILSGHFGIRKTVARVKLRYYWPGYLDDVGEWCRTCVVCQRRKNPRNKNIAPLQSIETGVEPFDQVALDILKLPMTPRGNQYVLLIEDYFSKWVEAFPLERTAAPSVAQCVMNGWISRFGCPSSILSDQGREFESKLFKSLNEMLQVTKIRTTTYHPRTDGMVERSNRTVIDVLSKYADGEPDWDLKLPLVLFAVRTSEHASTGFSPFLLTYGREARIPWDLVYGQPTPQPLPREEWVAQRKQDMIKIFKLVEERTKMAQKHQKKYYDKNLKGKFQVFQHGDLVMVCDPARRAKEGKLNSPWAGPYEVMERLSDALYSLEVKGVVKIYNTERLKKYYHRTEGRGRQREAATDSDSSESEQEDNELVDREEELREGDGEEDPQPEEQQHGEQQQPVAVEPKVRVPLMGHRGELWANLDRRNIVEGPRCRVNSNLAD